MTSTETDAVTQALPDSIRDAPELKSWLLRMLEEYNEAHQRLWGWQPNDPVRVMQLTTLVKIANAAPAGDFGEFGCHAGLMMKVVHQTMRPDVNLYGFDTFEGFKERDLEVERAIYLNKWQAGQHFPAISPTSVAHHIGDGTWPDNLKLVKGWFPRSFEGHEARPWRFVHIDFDLYQPIRAALELVWPNIVPGGVCVVHDYGCPGFPGVRLAVDEFFAPKGLAPVPLGDRWGSVALIKSKELADAGAGKIEPALTDKQSAVMSWMASVKQRAEPDLAWQEILELFQAFADAFPGHPFPLEVEKKGLDLMLLESPDRDDLRRRRAEIEALL